MRRRIVKAIRRLFGITIGLTLLAVLSTPPSAHAITDRELAVTRLHAGKETARECRQSQYEVVRGMWVKRWECFSPRATCSRWPWHRSVVVCAGSWLLLARRGEVFTGPYDLRCQWSMMYQKKPGIRWPRPLWKTKYVRCVRDDWS